MVLPHAFYVDLSCNIGSLHVKKAISVQVVAEFFFPTGGQSADNAVAEQRSMAVQRRLSNIKDAIAVTQWAAAAPHILLTVEGHGLQQCQDDNFNIMQALAQDKLALQNLGQLDFQQAAGILEQIRQCCGDLSGAEKLLFKEINACHAFWSFIEQEQFFGM